MPSCHWFAVRPYATDLHCISCYTWLSLVLISWLFTVPWLNIAHACIHLARAYRACTRHWFRAGVLATHCRAAVPAPAPLNTAGVPASFTWVPLTTCHVRATTAGSAFHARRLFTCARRRNVLPTCRAPAICLPFNTIPRHLAICILVRLCIAMTDSYRLSTCRAPTAHRDLFAVCRTVLCLFTTTPTCIPLCGYAGEFRCDVLPANL